LWPFTAVTRAPGQQSQALYPVPGSGVQSHVESADGWTPDHGDLRFVGYLVDLTI
jgi:predicted cobalt transporter CbtA